MLATVALCACAHLVHQSLLGGEMVLGIAHQLPERFDQLIQIAAQLWLRRLRRLSGGR